MTEYSLLESSIKIDKYIKFGIENNLKILAITDRNCLFGAAKFYEFAIKNNIKPIIGIDLDVEDFRLIILAKNYDGYLELVKLASLKGEGKSIQIADINSKNIYIIDHPRFGYYSKHKKELAIDNYYIGTNESLNNSNAVFISETNALYDKDFNALNLLYKIKHGINNNGENIWRGSYKLSSSLTNDHLLKNSFHIANNCNLTFPKHNDTIPHFPLEDKTSSANNFLREIVYQNLRDLELKKPNYIERLESELEVIQNMEFSDYFLIVYDFVKWAKSQDIAIGPGRGSAAGSLVTFLLDITNVDPIKNNLIFERFLNKDRISLPDIDIDIEDDRRQDVVNYIFDKYGHDKVAHIITFQRFGPRSSIRDAGRALGLSLPEVDSISKMINPFEPLESTYLKRSTFKNLIDKNEKYKEVYEIAQLIEGLPKNVATHAAGIVISNVPLVKRIPTIIAFDNKKQTQYSMNFLERHGLLKIDLLGLRNLSIIKSILNQIKHNWNKNLLIEKINLEDEQTKKILSSGDTFGIFQLESFGMRKALKEIKIDTFDDLVATISLYRPGPMDYIKLYASRKNKESHIDKVDKIIDKILEPTYGIMIYQEQILEIVQKYAGIPYSQADILRRAIGKKDKNQIIEFKKKFLNGVKEQNHNYEVGEKIFNMVEKFGLYGFNRSHACAYALIAYRMAFLKARFPLEYYTAIINSSLSSTKVLINYLIEAQTHSIKIHGPNINTSKTDVHNHNGEIFLPLTSITGLGNVANIKIMEEKNNNGHFKDFFDFMIRANMINLGNSNIENLILASALRDFGSTHELMESLPIAQRYADMIITSDKDGNKTIIKSHLPKPNLVKSQNDYFDFLNEKNKLGFNLSYNPMLKFNKSNLIRNINKFSNLHLFVKDFLIKETKNNKKIGIIKVYDGFVEQEAIIFERELSFSKETLKPNIVIFATMTFSEYNGSTEYIISNIKVVHKYEDNK